MSYVDGFVCAVPTVARKKYCKYAAGAALAFKEHGALSVVDCWGDDVPDVKLTSFPMAVKCQPNEIIFFWVVRPSRRARDEGMKNVMQDPRVDPRTNPMPFCGARLIFGGFDMIVNV